LGTFHARATASGTRSSVQRGAEPASISKTNEAFAPIW
jgi:hypothetical protein